MTQELENFTIFYEDTVARNMAIYRDLEGKAWGTPYLIDHREWVVRNFWGFGDACHWGMWRVLVDQMPQEFKFLEIGVYRGSILSLVSRIAHHQDKIAYLFGVTPLQATSDEQATYSETEHGFEADIETAFQLWGNGIPPQLIVGMSYEPRVIADTRMYGPFDIVYIDGSHVYECVAMDIFNYAPMVKSGGFLVMDDASWFLNFEPHIWRGCESVGFAIQEHLDTDPRFRHLFAIGHNRIWAREK